MNHHSLSTVPLLVALAASLPAQIIRGGDLVATNYGTPGLFRIEPNGTVTPIAGASQLAGPAGVTVTRKREIVLVDATANTLLKFDQNGVRSTIAGNLGLPLRVTEDLDGTFLVSSSNARTILRVTPGGTVTTAIPTAGFSRPLEAILDNDGNYIVVDDIGKRVMKVDRVTLALTTIYSGSPLSLPQGCYLFPNGDYAIFDGITDSVFRVTRGTNQISTWVSNPTLGANPDTMCPDHEGGFWIGTTTPKFSLEHVLPNGSLKQLISGPPFTNFEGLAFVPQLAGDLVFGTGPTTNALDLEVPTQSLKLYSIIASGSLFPGIPLGGSDARGTAINPDGLFFATFYQNTPPIFTSWSGLLDTTGRASASTALPFLGPGALAGLTIFAQAVTTDFSAPTGVGVITNPLWIRFQ